MKVRNLCTFLLVMLWIPFFSLGLSGQVMEEDSVTVRGTVFSTAGKPLSGVSVSISGTATAPVITDSTGTFCLQVPTLPRRLLFRSLAHTPREVYVEKADELTVYLTDPVLPGGYRTVSLGYHALEERRLIAPVSQVGMKEKYIDPVVTTGSYLQGKVAGLHVVNHSAMPGSGSYLMLRGPGSLNTTQQPLVVVDGMPLERPGTLVSRIPGNAHNPLASINPLDISEITLIKDAGASATYGVNGANGVLLINTLDPTATETTIDFMVRGGITAAPTLLPQLNQAQFRTLASEILASSSLYEETYEETYPGLFLMPGEMGYIPYQHDTRWQEQVFRTGINREVNLLVKGGDEISRYGLSVGYLNQDGNIKNTDFTRYNIRFTSFLRVYSWLEMNVNASLNNGVSNLIPSALSEEASPILTGLFKSPQLYPFNYDDNGNELRTISDVREFGVSNPYAVVHKSRSRNTGNRFITSMNLKADINSYLDWNSLVGLNLNSLKEEVFRPQVGMADYLDGLAYSYAEENNNKYHSIYTNHYLAFDRTLQTVHRLNASAGFRLQTNRLEHDWGRAKNLPDNDEFSELQSGENSLREIGGTSQVWNRFATYADFHYSFRDKYLAMAGASLDFSSRNGRESAALLQLGNVPLGMFYSVGAGWRLSSEPFMPSLPWLEDLLIRLSYGVAGNDDIGNVNALDYYEQVRYRETSGLIPGTIPNPALKHEDRQQLNAGMDLRIRGGRYALTMDYFHHRTSDLFYYEPQAAYTGYANRPSNGGQIINKGMEVSLFARLWQSSDLHWDLHGTFMLLRNHMESLEKPLLTSFPGGVYISRNGDPAASFYGYEFLGVFTSQEKAEEAGLVNERGIPYGAGDAIFRDISGQEGVPDGVINGYDKTILGSALPDYAGSISNHIGYRNFALDITLYFVVGNEVFNYVRYQDEQMSTLHNQSINTLRRWHQDGDQTDVPRALWNDPVGNAVFSSRWIEEGSYLRLKDITLSYDLHESWLAFRNATFFVTAKNFITLSPYLGYDPEFSHNYDPMQQGIDYGLMPQTRQFLMGVRVGL